MCEIGRYMGVKTSRRKSRINRPHSCLGSYISRTIMVTYPPGCSTFLVPTKLGHVGPRP